MTVTCTTHLAIPIYCDLVQYALRRFCDREPIAIGSNEFCYCDVMITDAADCLMCSVTVHCQRPELTIVALKGQRNRVGDGYKYYTSYEWFIAC